jgi:hypothetical protein
MQILSAQTVPSINAIKYRAFSQIPLRQTELSRCFLSRLPVQAAYYGRGGVSGLLEVRFQAADPRGLFHTRLEDGYFLLHFRPQADLPVFNTHLGECAA